jgi:hypothetical protein
LCYVAFNIVAVFSVRKHALQEKRAQSISRGRALFPHVTAHLEEKNDYFFHSWCKPFTEFNSELA